MKSRESEKADLKRNMLLVKREGYSVIYLDEISVGNMSVVTAIIGNRIIRHTILNCMLK